MPTPAGPAEPEPLGSSHPHSLLVERLAGARIRPVFGLRDRVADNLAKHEGTESESLLIGRDFGVVTDIETGPDGNLYAVSLTNGAIYEIFGRR